MNGLQPTISADPVAALAQAPLAADPADVLALTMLGLHSTAVSQFEMAEPLLRRAVEQTPASGSLTNNDLSR